MSIEIADVRTRTDLKRWVKFPFSHYRGDPRYVPPLYREELGYFDPRKNPAFAVCEVRQFLALNDGRPVGRICGMVNSLETRKLGHKRGRFGWFESIDDTDVADALLGAVRDWQEQEGCAEMTGPHGFTDLDVEGLLVDGFESIPTAAGSYNFPYYAGLLESFGLVKDVDYLDFRFKVPERVPFLERLSRRIDHSGTYQVRRAGDRKTFAAYVKQMWPVLEAAFEPLYGVVPLSREQEAYYTQKYFGFLDPEFFVFIFSKDNELVAFLAAMPNISEGLRKARGRLFPTGLFHVRKNLKHPETVDFLVGGALPGHPGNTLTALGLRHMFDRLQSRGVHFVETNHELESNSTVTGMWRRFDVAATRRSRVYRLPLVP